MQAYEALEIYQLKALKISWNGSLIDLEFRSAQLFIDLSEYDLSWFVDASYLNNDEFLQALSRSIDIKVMIYAETMEGMQLSGLGYMHPNLPVSCASIKGDGVLFGYEEMKRNE
ncbi:hypothetical protein [Ferviditalea candida]|uniref:Uncharacterized protein n=1 Tax=Ferviditalea candida TaxID=3108399 RepID=A0ABU5ZM94_9BACL|nr:hypothetical protein [Paenibacillaceae bacterium T2]